MMQDMKNVTSASHSRLAQLMVKKHLAFDAVVWMKYNNMPEKI